MRDQPDQPQNPPELPRHPRLAEHVAVRRHLVAGEVVVVLHDTDSEQLATLGQREWAVLSCADGTRDLAAASRLGQPTSREHLEEFLVQLAAAGMLREGPAPAVSAPPPRSVVADRPVVLPAGFGYHCDGSGSCCRIYQTTLFSPEEAVRARAVAPELLGAGQDGTAAFTPERGSTGPTPEAAGHCWRAAAVTMVQGRCAYLSSQQRCLLHERAGAEAKPLGCRLFPAVFVDDGRELRVTAAPECACVLRPWSGGQDAEALVADDVTTAGDLDPAIAIDVLPEAIAISADKHVPCAVYLRWSDGLEGPKEHDVAQYLVDLAAGFGGNDDLERSPLPRRLEQELRVLRKRVAQRAARDACWRASTDLARLVPEWVGHAIESLLQPGLIPPDADIGAEQRYYCLVAHGHLWVTSRRPLAEELRARSARLLVARQLRAQRSLWTTSLPAQDHVADQPLALVEAAARAFAW